MIQPPEVSYALADGMQNPPLLTLSPGDKLLFLKRNSTIQNLDQMSSADQDMLQRSRPK